MNTNLYTLKQNFLNIELGFRLEKVFQNHFGIFLSISHTFGLGTVYQENIIFNYNSIFQGNMQRNYSGAGIYTSLGLRYHFDIGFLKKKLNKNIDLQNREVPTLVKPKKKPKFIFTF